MARKKSPAVAYYRTSSAANVGAHKDSQRRQAEAVEAFARCRHELAEAFYDPAVSGADPVDSRPGFSALLAHCEAHGIGVVLAENASGFARDLAVQLTGHALLRDRGIELGPGRRAVGIRDLLSRSFCRAWHAETSFRPSCHLEVKPRRL